jgi:hypothetical protein
LPAFVVALTPLCFLEVLLAVVVVEVEFAADVVEVVLLSAVQLHYFHLQCQFLLVVFGKLLFQLPALPDHLFEVRLLYLLWLLCELLRLACADLLLDRDLRVLHLGGLAGS